MEKPGSKYEYWKVPGQKAIFEEDWGQNMILGIFGIKTWFLGILVLKHDFENLWINMQIWGKKIRCKQDEMN